MGQYFKAVVLSPSDDKPEILASYQAWDHDNNGAKLTEHSWIGNYFVSSMEALFTQYGPYYKHRLVWAGDYDEPETGSDNNLYELSKKVLKRSEVIRRPQFKYLVNHSKRIFTDKSKTKPDKAGWQVHPLPLLTASGNVGESGDYYPADGNQQAALGSWARDIISVEKDIPAGYTELIISF